MTTDQHVPFGVFGGSGFCDFPDGAVEIVVDALRSTRRPGRCRLGPFTRVAVPPTGARRYVGSTG